MIPLYHMYRVPLSPASQSFNSTVIPVAVYLADIIIQRNVTYNKSQYQVVGPGTKGTFRIDADRNSMDFVSYIQQVLALTDWGLGIVQI
jgi:hypothetical protein